LKNQPFIEARQKVAIHRGKAKSGHPSRQGNLARQGKTDMPDVGFVFHAGNGHFWTVRSGAACWLV
jgi:hypothetical protein